MKKIYFIRHAKAVEESEGGDFERDLSERGKKDLALMCERLKKHEVRADAIFASPAKRCAKTVQKLAAAVKFEKKIKFKDELYGAQMHELLEFVRKLDDKFQSVFIVAHNDAITEICELLSDAAIGNIPTCGIFCVKFDGNFKELKEHGAKALFFDYPKKHKKS
ncbi:putative phosphohistidine phosphatase SixA [Campylobacter rectus RM3267]|uniref:Phosphohistidine phosphatase n=2 Tax=Campylobacter rectus TaxID=203 RepID=A0A6G5QMA4_CAMRE|nr:histidine phosphatase family protein [Campylobacter rectus]EEF12861.1 putative phosphohistidine phosphatase SixA [Campylobacter rectus RM3267]QCD46781.1 phosphohistidine phosphatase [Campylobacter rectus]UEB47487.1 histidine phosphatase family protein [Campylobacter rectus]